LNTATYAHFYAQVFIFFKINVSGKGVFFTAGRAIESAFFGRIRF